jgi:RHS repeat-associated protein
MDEYIGDYNELLYLRSRYYAPRMGRFFQKDPSRQEKNLYRYANGNPINFTDPDGLVFITRSVFSPAKFKAQEVKGCTPHLPGRAKGQDTGFLCREFQIEFLQPFPQGFVKPLCIFFLIS